MRKEDFTYIRFKILSRKESVLELSKKILAVINELEKHNYEKKIVKYLGDQYIQNGITSKEIHTYLTKKQEDITVFSNETKEFNLFLTEEICGDEIYDCLWFSFNALIPGFPKIPDLKSLLNLLKSLFISFKGIYAYTEDEEILQVYFAQRSYDKILSQLPFDYIDFLPKPDLDFTNRFNIPSHFSTNEINISEVPNGFWWINFLSKKQIENLNLNSTINDWHYTEVINNEYTLYVLSDTFLNLNNKEHLLKLQNLIHKTALITIQEKSIK
ncbi:hypothetical protein J2Y38_004068 [Flavobacterium sp. 2755]|uniref:hypothetical protein n=1 Tax=Flavobacterium sp. 2755 TaxID=2817765 RepID=UPI002855C1C1|nr:hypothetical protein [Flavobacterium sp. 2755]MDR6763844.1 hypothetical protein [Flavobacterium sp. 2755]